jgi:hypothetical protein
LRNEQGKLKTEKDMERKSGFAILKEERLKVGIGVREMDVDVESAEWMEWNGMVWYWLLVIIEG